MTYRDLVEHSWKHSSLQHWYSHSESKLCSIGLCKSQLRWNIRFSCIGTIAKLKVNNFWNIKGWRGFLCISLLKTGKLSLFGCGSRQFSCVTIWCDLRQLSCVFHLPFGTYPIQAKQHSISKLWEVVVPIAVRSTYYFVAFNWHVTKQCTLPQKE